MSRMNNEAVKSNLKAISNYVVEEIRSLVENGSIRIKR